MKKEMIYEEVLGMLNDRVDYKSITLSEVARRCGMGKSTIYEYFVSKDEMVFNSIIFYLNRMIKFFSNGFKITTFRASLKVFIKAVIITMKANYWMVMPWTFIDNYAPFLTEEDADTISELLYKCKDVILELFSAICDKGVEEGILFEIDQNNINFAYNGIICSLTEEVDSEYDYDSDESKLFVEDLCACILRQLN